jgi:hypothetical protein
MKIVNNVEHSSHIRSGIFVNFGGKDNDVIELHRVNVLLPLIVVTRLSSENLIEINFVPPNAFEPKDVNVPAISTVLGRLTLFPELLYEVMAAFTLAWDNSMEPMMVIDPSSLPSNVAAPLSTLNVYTISFISSTRQ